MSRMLLGALALAFVVTFLPAERAHAQRAPAPGASHGLLGPTLLAGARLASPSPSGAPAVLASSVLGLGALTLDQASKQYTQTTRTYHNDLGLILAGSILLGVGYVTAIVFGVILPSDYLFIPVIGGVILAPLRPDAWGLSVGLGTFALQATGLALLLVGLLVLHPDDEPAAASLAPRLVDGPGDAGLGLRWQF